MPPPVDRSPPRLAYVLAWAAFLAITLAWLGRPVVTRAQEGRVLETARQMLDSHTLNGWLLPQLNGEPRLRKPPLAYWYTAASFRLFGSVGEFAGRLPTLLISWLTLAATWAFARDLAGRRFGFFAAAALASSYLFLRYTRQAETDPPAMLGTIVACWAIWRGARGSLAWFHLAALGIALAAMAKGGPAVFPLVFLVALAISERLWRPITRFLISGAPVLALVLIVPWFVYVRTAPGASQVGQEVNVLLTGRNHFGLFYEYAGPLLVSVLPWTGWFVLALIVAWQTRRVADEPRRIALLACLAVALPLSVTLNVQPHYLLPMMPACGLLVAWIVVRFLDSTGVGGVGGTPPTAGVDDAASAAYRPRHPDETPAIDARWIEASRWVLGGVGVLLAIVGPAVIVAAVVVKHRVAAVDVVTALAFAAAAGWLIVRYRDARPSGQLAATALAMLVVMPLVACHWAPSLDGEGLRGLAPQARAALRQKLSAEPGPFLTFGTDANITLGYYLREPVPITNDPPAVHAFLAEHPAGVVIAEHPRKRPTTQPLPGELAPAFEARTGNDDVTTFYVATH